MYSQAIRLYLHPGSFFVQLLGGGMNTALPHQAGASTLKVYYLDAGQGDSTLIKTPKGQHILIDAETILKDRMPSKILKAWASSSWMPRLRHIRTLTI